MFASPRALMLGVRVGANNVAATAWTYVALAGVSIPLAFAVGGLAQESFGMSLASQDFVRRTDPVLLLELFRERRGSLLALIPVAIGSLVLWAVVSTYLSGAILSAITRADRAETAEFFSGGGRVFGRLMRLLGLGLPFVLLAGGLPSFGLYKVVNLATENMVSEKEVLLLRAGTLLLALAFIAWASGAYDLMRIEAVGRGEHRARFAFVRGLQRAVRNPVSLILLSLPFAIAFLLLTLIGYVIEAKIVTGSWILIAVMILLEQVIAYLRALLRVALAASQVALVTFADENARFGSRS